MKTKSGERGSSASLDDKLQQHIGVKLKQYYDEIVSEEVPDRFKQLLDALEQRQATPSPSEEKTESEA
jgi:hypothetical protein